MSIAVYRTLSAHGTIVQDELVKQFCALHERDPNRGYGATVRRLLREIDAGSPWQDVSRGAFDGMGSMGNGAAMRVGPIGAYFFDDHAKILDEAHRSAEVTHAHPEAIAGAIAVAMAVARATELGIREQHCLPEEFIEEIVQALPDTDTRAKLTKSLSIPRGYHIDTVRTVLGNGEKMTAQDTVPFAVWCAAHHLDSLEEALWTAVSVLGDRDTICAMVGGIVVMAAGLETAPQSWLDSVEDVEVSEFW